MPKLERLPDWVNSLNNWIEHVREIPFSWGNNDCCLSACNAVLAITGIDVAAQFRNQYFNKSGALMILEEYGGVNGIAEAVFSSQFKCRSVDPYLGRRGDVALLKNDDIDFECLGVCGGSNIVCPSDKGAKFLSISLASKVWRIG